MAAETKQGIVRLVDSVESPERAKGVQGRPTWRQLLQTGQKRLKEAGIAEYELDAWYLFEDAFHISRMQYLLCSVETADMDDASKERYETGIARRSKREPLQHILGVQEFMGLEFFVNEHTLIPRQDTETLVELVLSKHRDKTCSVLDMCTGSGCIAVSLAKLGDYSRVEAADLSKEALQMTWKNAKKHLQNWNICFESTSTGLDSEMEPKQTKLSETPEQSDNTDEENRVFRLHHSDLFCAFDNDVRFDVIVSNPPYIPSAVIEGLEPEVRDFEPRMALDGTEDGLYFYKRLAEECGAFLNANGSVYFEIGHDQGEAVSELLAAHGFQDIKVIKDLAGQDRVVCGTWVNVQIGGSPA